jgi:hypothetical protein
MISDYLPTKRHTRKTWYVVRWSSAFQRTNADNEGRTKLGEIQGNYFYQVQTAVFCCVSIIICMLCCCFFGNGKM